MTCSYGIAGRSFCIQADDEAIAGLTSRVLGDYQFALNCSDSCTDLAFTIRISSDGIAPAIPEGLETFEVPFGQCYTDGETYYLLIRDSVMIVDGSGLDVWIGNTGEARQPESMANMISYAVETSLRRSGLYQLHGGGVVEPREQTGLLIIGGSGSGKTTLTALLASRGWSYLTDDALVLSNDEGTVIARGIRRFFAVSDKTLAACQMNGVNGALGQPMQSDPSKRRLEPTVAFPSKWIQCCVPKVLLFSSITNESTSRIQKLTPRETMTRLIKFNPWASYDKITARSHLRMLNQLAEQCRSFSLAAGSEILIKPECAEELVTPLLEI
jgi:hypothetical protein